MKALALAAALADPRAGESRLSGEPPEPEEIVSILRCNKVPLLEIPPQACPETLAGCEAWKEALAREQVEREELLAEWERVAERFSRAGIETVLFKSAGELPYRSSNLDTLVDPGRLEDARRILEEAGHHRITNYREEHKLLFRRFRAGRSVISVHLHDAISWGRVLILEGRGVVRRSRPSPRGRFRIAAAPDRLIAMLAHCLYETDQIRISDLRLLRGGASDPEFDWEVMIQRVLERGWRIGFHAILALAVGLETGLYGGSCVPEAVRAAGRSALAHARWAGWHVQRRVRRLSQAPPSTMPYPISKIYSKVHYLERLLRERSRAPDERIEDLLATVGNLAANRIRLRCRPAIVVSLSGLDGAGKSTVARAVGDAMTLCEIPVREVWSRGGFSRWMELLKQGGRRAMPAAIPAADDAAGKRRWLARPLAGLCFAAAVVIEQIAHYTLRVGLARRWGFTIVCDRYTYDTAADLHAKLGRSRRLARWAGELLVGVVRRPDLPILLHIRPRMAERRKPGDVPPAHLPAQAAALALLAERHRLIRIDADRPVPDVVDDVVDAALRAAFARFARRAPQENLS